jgi:formiminotetrahydrofolate cyclodeaminase
MNFTVDSAFLNALADPAPTPAGGSAAAYAGAMAATLVTMVAKTTLGKKKYADVQDLMRQIVAEAEACRAELEQCVSRDAEAFEGLLAAYRAARETPNPAVIEQATLLVTTVPLGTANTVLHVLELAVKVAATGNINAVSDACAAAALANSSIYASALNVKVNAKSLDHHRQESVLAQIGSIEAQANERMTQLQPIIQERMGIG